MIKLTERQSQIYEYILSFLQKYGYPPSRAEIAQEFGFKSSNSAEDHLKALAKKGCIELTHGKSRGIRVIEEAEDSSYLQEKITQITSQILVPLVGRVAAGNPILAIEHIDRQFAIDPKTFDLLPDYFLEVKGDSMKDIGILEGDFLAVKRQSDARNGQVIVARIDEEVTVKRFLRKATHIELLAENPNYAPIIVTPDMPFTIEGLAVGLIRPHSFM
ncbi:transcriptional repressor LexA [Basilea psittacipulmonis]|uniref:LexA repressor n=1 Tax=Basilea psittacipulmonis DSM 24701 TaxID=1072685 RepID=A0A077DD37_9BURK|nr:transcriptional repressor LexA [Basilea psittacipulmonis]AIL32745.1 LexA family transcriptional regulator [Basilea psittacipulmonis DSM 24701]